MRRTKEKIVDEIVRALEGKELSINEIARKIKANWSTTNKALALLKRLGIIEETITTPKIRIVKLASKGKRTSYRK